MESILLEKNGVEEEKDQIDPTLNRLNSDLVYLHVIGVLIKNFHSFNLDTLSEKAILYSQVQVHVKVKNVKLIYSGHALSYTALSLTRLQAYHLNTYLK